MLRAASQALRRTSLERRVHSCKRARWPIQVLSGTETNNAVEEYTLLVQRYGFRGQLPPHLGVNVKGHLLFRWMHDIVTHAKVVDAVETMLGSPNVLVLESNFLAKSSLNKAAVDWHQDNTYWGYDDSMCTAWIAFTASNEDNGCLQVALGAQNPNVSPVQFSKSKQAHANFRLDRNQITKQ
jgi:hypothetical protein